MKLPVLRALGIVDCAILVRVKPNHFSLIEESGAWIRKLIPNIDKRGNVELGNHSVFLNDFLLDAEDYWAKQEDARLASGIWTEKYGDSSLYFEAFACRYHDQCYLIITNAEKSFHERKQTLQIARDMSISNEKTVERHDYLTERLQSILLDKSQADQQLPLYEAIKHASIGIIITSNILDVEHINLCAFEIFDQSDNMDKEYLLAMLAGTINKQYPEQNVFENNKHFSGEVFWHTPPHASKWLNVRVQPVFGATGKLQHWVISFNDQTRIKHLLQSNEELSLHDSLTGLPNRQYFWKQLQQSIAQKEPFYLISLDIANFKYINELYGYLEGDEILKQVAVRLKSVLQTSDFITRIGADEFMIIRKITETGAQTQSTFEFAQSIYDTCLKPLYTRNNSRCELGVALGFAAFPRDAQNAEEVMICANLALSSAKTNNKLNAPIKMYSEELKFASERKLNLETALRSAIELNELEVYLQPIYNISTRDIIKAEALLRWHHDGKTIYPDEFIPIAESSGSINALGRWVIQRAFEMMEELHSQNVDIPISINFSPQQIYDNTLISLIKQKMNAAPGARNLLDLEVTENVLIANYEKVSAFLHEVKSYGVSISVDDFGTGYCSLAYLKHLPIDTIKIDRSFIKDVDTNTDDSAIVAAIIALAQKLNINIVAEGIENPLQEDFLIENNCSTAQGFLYSHPLPFEEFTRIFKAKKTL